ncbi:alpha/beta-type small acid-soluble spore protein [Bacillus cereus]|nr:alpha/beta-type small acid-soluble spore protein [Bacillus cereus]
MKYGVARELSVILGPDSIVRAKGSIGGEITKRLVCIGQEQIVDQYKIH